MFDRKGYVQHLFGGLIIEKERETNELPIGATLNSAFEHRETLTDHIRSVVVVIVVVFTRRRYLSCKEGVEHRRTSSLAVPGCLTSITVR